MYQLSVRNISEKDVWLSTRIFNLGGERKPQHFGEGFVVTDKGCPASGSYIVDLKNGFDLLQRERHVF